MAKKHRTEDNKPHQDGGAGQIPSSDLPDPATLKTDSDILSAYFDASRLCYLRFPDNEHEKAYLANNVELFRISSC